MQPTYTVSNNCGPLRVSMQIYTLNVYVARLGLRAPSPGFVQNIVSVRHQKKISFETLDSTKWTQISFSLLHQPHLRCTLRRLHQLCCAFLFGCLPRPAGMHHVVTLLHPYPASHKRAALHLWRRLPDPLGVCLRAARWLHLTRHHHPPPPLLVLSCVCNIGTPSRR